jgi:oligo-1,6-glucosidase
VLRVVRLADLGVDVVWFSPLYRSPQDDNGYDISHRGRADTVWSRYSTLKPKEIRLY